MYVVLRRYVPMLILGCAVLFGAIGRGTALYTWDGDYTLHPDERFLVYTVVRLQVPEQWQSYINNDCVVAGKVPAASATRDLRGMELSPAQWEPSRTSGCNSLNPRNYGWSQRFVYGALPTTLVRVMSDWVFGRDATPLEIRNTGRTIAWASEILTIMLVYWLARALLPPRASAWAAFLYALAPLPMQLSHFFTVDALLSPWVVAALGIALRLNHMRRRDWWMFAVCVAIASAMRITMLSLAGLALIVLIRQRAEKPWRTVALATNSIFVGMLVLWLADPTWWQGMWFEPRWLADIVAAGKIVAGDVDTPPTFQWVDAIPWVYPWWQLSWWGLGPVVAGCAVYGSWLYLGRSWHRSWMLVAWVVMFFVWQGGVFGMTMRYYLPIYAGLSVLAVGGLVGVARRWRRVALVVMLASSSVMALAWQQMYTTPHPRIAASEWIYQHIPVGATIAVEQWDDALPLVVGNDTPGRYQFEELKVFEADRPSKFLSLEANQLGLIDQIATADYIVLSSARGHAVIPDMPLRFPVTTRYYAMLFDGSLGFIQVYQAERWPHIGAWWRNTRVAEEALSVYDHPQVVIFANREHLTAGELAQRLLADVQWSGVAHTTTKNYRAYPAMGLIDDTIWYAVQQPALSWRGSGGWSTWLLLIDGLMLMLVPWLSRWRDHGVTLGRAFGMLVLIGVASIALPLSTIMIGIGCVVPLALWGWWRHWRQIVIQVRREWRLVIGGELIWLVMVGISAWLAGGASQPNDWWRHVAMIQQQMSAQWPVVADPWLAGFAYLDAGGVIRAAALLSIVSGSDAQIALLMMLATASGVMAQLLWYAVSAQTLTTRQLIWRGAVIIGILLAGNLVPLVRAMLGVDDPLWSAVHTADGSQWVPMTWAIGLIRADSMWLWQGVWLALCAFVAWRRAWKELVLLGCVGYVLGTEALWWATALGCAIGWWHWRGQRRGWVVLIAGALLIRAVSWHLPQGSATMMLLHAWPLIGVLGLLVWRNAQRQRIDMWVAILWGLWGVLCALMQMPIWLLLAGWGICAAVLRRRYGMAIWFGLGCIGLIAMMPLPLMAIGYGLMTFVIWGYVGYQMLQRMHFVWWLAPALIWLVWAGSIVRPTLSAEEVAIASQIRRHDKTLIVLVDKDINRAQRIAAASGALLWVAPPSQLDVRWLGLGWRDAIRQRWNHTLEADSALICAENPRVTVVVHDDSVRFCR